MANKDFPRGLAPYQEVLRANVYTLSSGYAANVFVGDPVVGNTAGDVVLASAGSANAMMGAVLAVYDVNGVPLQYWPTGNAGVGYVLVADHPDQMFVAQGDGDTSYLDAADRLGNISMVSGAGSTVYYRSGWELDDSAAASNDGNAQIRLLKPVPVEGNTIAIAHCDWIVRINNHQAGPGAVGAGV